MLPYGRQSISEDDIQAVVDVLRGDWLTTGPLVSAFESKISELTGGHRAVTATSGTAALHMAYAAAGISEGDVVISTPMTFIATTSTASMRGARIVFADVEEDTALIDPDAVDALIDDRTRIIAAVDYAGHPADYDRLTATAARYGALVLDDAAHSIGSTYNGRPVGDLADITTLSFFPTKNLTTGEGGALVAKDPELAQRAHEFHNIGLVRDASRFQVPGEGAWHQEVHEFGVNYRLTDIACALGLSQLSRLDAFKRRRAEITRRYDDALADLDGVRRPVQRENVDAMRHLYPVRILDGRRREVFDRMRELGVGVQVNYMPVYWHPVYADAGYRRGMCPNAEAFYREELSLPIHPELTDSQVDQVVDALAEALR
ncbi:UDP-4-amino-4,6-dideoxy-N-acetyl-beta-L-altrosamine transaminase [Microbacterium oxydans]|uniref:UDP-4-amino-4, 6-dideoxy-N-acetyl-beta-L-altrosamine transaminase n=1 Tax=Microbacterium TaxID=33882 RepID=UPI00187D4D24|nr:UDP-4-amino-4,6-dideoxy-N-acetyl-beta-L-altrosamine transaminase [Microbacterium sp. R1]MBE7954061.1 UDP-4-amino-4,6-dideoxy-N-acetyl-beta-L-altrosamine transaminase [Microbacterium sp. R1]MCB8044823.1 UDP-4-amino-4,6-dideoxy-N-acetyl-beta-L-altrosamine transaminase [Microbacterium oxydans]